MIGPVRTIVCILAAFAGQAWAEDRTEALNVEPVSTHVGEMSAGGFSLEQTEERLRFEPIQMLGDMFARDDVVYIMRHGPTDWSKLDERDVAPGDCANQRIMSDLGAVQMRDFGSLLAHNGVVPSRIVVSEWCRNQQTLEHLRTGFDRINPAILADVPMETDPELNLLLSLQGARNVEALRQRVSSWEGEPGRTGPLLLITHFTNIQELTQFSVFEGEILILDPKRNNQVIGTLRLRSASPDVGHFEEALGSPLLREEQAFDMVTRFYQALNLGDETMLRTVVDPDWQMAGATPADQGQDVGAFLRDLARYTDGLENGRFDIEDVHVSDDVVTVIGTIYGRHTADLFGVPATGREVSFGGISVHRIAEGAIVESWQLADRAALMDQITAE
ncbi:MAG: ester cyclase [Pseudomonadota bacterium]